MGTRFNRPAEIPLDQALSRELVQEQTNQTLDELEVFSELVLAGQVPPSVRALLSGEDLAEPQCQLRLESWRSANLENLALLIESSGVVRAHIDILETADLWDFCSDCRWLEGTLQHRLGSH